jgi:hypothetical protein
MLGGSFTNVLGSNMALNASYVSLRKLVGNFSALPLFSLMDSFSLPVFAVFEPCLVVKHKCVGRLVYAAFRSSLMVYWNELSLFYESLMRAVLLSCTNEPSFSELNQLALEVFEVDIMH